MGQLEELNGSAMEIPDSGVVGFFSEDYLSHQSELGMPFPDHVSGLLPAECQTPAAPPQSKASIAEQSQGDRKRKGMEASVAEQSQGDRQRKGMEAPVSNSEHASAALSESGLRVLEIKKISNVRCDMMLIVRLSIILYSLEVQRFLSFVPCSWILPLPTSAQGVGREGEAIRGKRRSPKRWFM